MNDRIKKLYSWSFPIVVIAGVLYLTVSSINGDGVGNPQKYAAQLQPIKPFFASISSSISASVSLLWEKINNATSPTQTAPESTSNNSNISIPTSTSQKNVSSSSGTSPVNSHVFIPPPVSQKGASSSLVTGNASSKTYSGNGFTPSTHFPDLAIQIVDTGILSGNDIFTHATSVEPGQRGAVVFDVKNIGGSVSPEWNFSAKIPTPSADFTSETQFALAPGEGIRFTMAFSNLQSNGTNTVSFAVDPNTKIPNDPDRKNNTASATLFRDY